MADGSAHTSWEELRQMIVDEIGGEQVMTKAREYYKQHMIEWRADPPDEYPDTTIIEFESGSDWYVAQRDDSMDAEGANWLLAGHPVAMTWTDMVHDFGSQALRDAIRLNREPEDVHKLALWPTNMISEVTDGLE